MKQVIKILKLRGSDWSAYFLAFEIMKNKSYKGLQVTHWDDKRKPDKAKQTFVSPSDITWHKGYGMWHEIPASEIPADIQARFAEAA